MINKRITTVHEFNEKYKDYLVEGHYGLDIQDTYFIIWLDSQFKEYVKIPGFKYFQIKEKFGYGRFYCKELGFNEVNKVEEKISNIYHPRLLSVLLKLLKENYCDGISYSKGFYEIIDKMLTLSIISQKEYGILRNYISCHRPNKFSSFAAWEYRNSDLWFPPYDSKHRLQWLNKHIKINKN